MFWELQDFWISESGIWIVNYSFSWRHLTTKNHNSFVLILQVSRVLPNRVDCVCWSELLPLTNAKDSLLRKQTASINTLPKELWRCGRSWWYSIIWSVIRLCSVLGKRRKKLSINFPGLPIGWVVTHSMCYQLHLIQNGFQQRNPIQSEPGLDDHHHHHGSTQLFDAINKARTWSVITMAHHCWHLCTDCYFFVNVWSLPTFTLLQQALSSKVYCSHSLDGSNLCP